MIQKIAIVYHALRCGGAEKELLSYISMLDKNRYEVHILLTQKIGELLNNIPKHAHIHEVGGNSVKPNLTYLVSLYANLKKIEPSITLGFMQDICLSIGILHLLRLISGKFIISEQVVLSEWQKVKKTFFIKRVLISFLYKHADTILAQTQSIKDDLINNFSIHQNRIVVMPSYIENTLKQVNNHVTDNKYFLYVGRLEPEKNVITLLRAFTLIYKKYDYIQLIIVGKSNKEFVTQIQTLGLDKNVILLGYQKNVTSYYKHALALIIPSFVEGRSRVMIEAMSHRCVVISSDFPGYKHVIEHKKTGFVFSRNNIAELQNLLLYIVNSKNTSTIKLIKTQAKQFIMKSHFEMYSKLYKKILNNSLRNSYP